MQAEACNFIKKEILAQVSSREFCKISNNTFLTEHFQATVSGYDANAFEGVDRDRWIRSLQMLLVGYSCHSHSVSITVKKVVN